MSRGFSSRLPRATRPGNPVPFAEPYDAARGVDRPNPAELGDQGIESAPHTLINRAGGVHSETPCSSSAMASEMGRPVAAWIQSQRWHCLRGPQREVPGDHTSDLGTRPPLNRPGPPSAACREPDTAPSPRPAPAREVQASSVLRLRPDDLDPDPPAIDFTTLAVAAWAIRTGWRGVAEDVGCATTAQAGRRRTRPRR